MSDIKEVRFSRRLTGYCDKDTNFIVSLRLVGTAPPIEIYSSGKYEGHLILDYRATKELIRALEFLLGTDKE